MELGATLSEIAYLITISDAHNFNMYVEDQIGYFCSYPPPTFTNL